jgi:glycosyltransferase involved in cell wall biosynthesis
MSSRNDITVLILTYNEEANIARTLAALARFSEVIIIDSHSSDRTCEIAGLHQNVRVVKRAFDRHADQWNFGLAHCGRTWVLALDADFVVPPDLVDEIMALPSSSTLAGYRVCFRYCIYGKPLSAALYPPVIALFRRECTTYVQEGHTQRAMVDGKIGALRGMIDHDDRKPLSRWFASQQKYSQLEAEHLLEKPRDRLRSTDRIRLMGWPAPILVFVHTLLIKRCLFDGWPGWLYVLQRAVAEAMIALALIDHRLGGVEGHVGGGRSRGSNYRSEDAAG